MASARSSCANRWWPPPGACPVDACPGWLRPAISGVGIVIFDGRPISADEPRLKWATVIESANRARRLSSARRRDSDRKACGQLGHSRPRPAASRPNRNLYTRRVAIGPGDPASACECSRDSRRYPMRGLEPPSIAERRPRSEPTPQGRMDCVESSKDLAMNACDGLPAGGLPRAGCARIMSGPGEIERLGQCLWT